MRVLGVDPGQTGALAVVDDGWLLDLIDMPTGPVRVGKATRTRIIPELLAEVIRRLLPLDIAYVEKVSAMPKQGVSSTFVFGQGHGLVLGTLAAFRVRTELITPQAWRKLAAVRGAKKDGSRHRACQLFRNQVEKFARVKDADRAEAALIAYAGTLKEKGEGK